MTTIPLPEVVLTLWFGMKGYAPSNDVDYIKSRMPLWFGKHDEFEKAQQELAASMLETIKSWETSPPYDNLDFDAWNTRKGYLARVILFDQIPRCVFRATPRAFSYDSIAVKYALKLAEDQTLWNECIAIERLFIIVSIQHLEDFSLQEKGVSLANGIGSNESEEIQIYFKNLKGFPMEHHDVIRDFGRFPGRNAVLVSALYTHFLALITIEMIRDENQDQKK